MPLLSITNWINCRQSNNQSWGISLKLPLLLDLLHHMVLMIIDPFCSCLLLCLLFHSSNVTRMEQFITSCVHFRGCCPARTDVALRQLEVVIQSFCGIVTNEGDAFAMEALPILVNSPAPTNYSVVIPDNFDGRK